MARPEHWTDRVVALARAEREGSREAIHNVIARPILRRPNTKTLLEAAIRDPSSVDPSGRAALAGYLRQTWGQAAENVIPYLGVEEEES